MLSACRVVALLAATLLLLAYPALVFGQRQTCYDCCNQNGNCPGCSCNNNSSGSSLAGWSDTHSTRSADSSLSRAHRDRQTPHTGRACGADSELTCLADWCARPVSLARIIAIIVVRTRTHEQQPRRVRTRGPPGDTHLAFVFPCVVQIGCILCCLIPLCCFMRMMSCGPFRGSPMTTYVEQPPPYVQQPPPYVQRPYTTVVN